MSGPTQAWKLGQTTTSFSLTNIDNSLFEDEDFVFYMYNTNDLKKSLFIYHSFISCKYFLE